MSVTVKRPVLVKVVVTEDYKASRCAEMRTALARLDVVGKQISARLESGADGALKNRLRAESSRNDAARTALKRELEKLSALEYGAEYDLTTLEGSVELNVGDDFLNLGPCEVVVKDSRIIEIRDGVCPEVSKTSS